MSSSFFFLREKYNLRTDKGNQHEQYNYNCKSYQQRESQQNILCYSYALHLIGAKRYRMVQCAYSDNPTMQNELMIKKNDLKNKSETKETI